MENAKILLIEDSEDTRAYINRWIAKSSHNIVREAERLSEALAAVDDIAIGGSDCDLILLDGNIEPSSDNNRDARTIIERINGYGLETKVIGISSVPLYLTGVTVEAECNKIELSELPSMIDRL